MYVAELYSTGVLYALRKRNNATCVALKLCILRHLSSTGAKYAPCVFIVCNLHTPGFMNIAESCLKCVKYASFQWNLPNLCKYEVLWIEL